MYVPTGAFVAVMVLAFVVGYAVCGLFYDERR